MGVVLGYWSTGADVTANRNENTKSIKLQFNSEILFRYSLEITFVCYNKDLMCCTGKLGVLDIGY